MHVTQSQSCAMQRDTAFYSTAFLTGDFLNACRIMRMMRITPSRKRSD
jgi:hypothetical protein